MINAPVLLIFGGIIMMALTMIAFGLGQLLERKP